MLYGRQVTIHPIHDSIQLNESEFMIQPTRYFFLKKIKMKFYYQKIANLFAYYYQRKFPFC